MLLSFALILLLGLAFGKIFERIKLPSLVGMLLVGILIGPYVFNLIDISVLNISSELRQVALIIILLRAGLNLDIQELKKVGFSAILLCFVPACFEIVGMAILAPLLLNVSVLEGVLIGTVVAAVSPAVIVPRMIKLKEEGYGTNKAIPQMVMAGASVDDVFVIVLFTAFSGLLSTGQISPLSFVKIPTSIILGIFVGIACGIIMSKLFQKLRLDNISLSIITICVAFILVSLEKLFTGFIGFSGLLAIMTLGIILSKGQKDLGEKLSGVFSKLWIPAQILLFVLVGAEVNISFAIKAGGVAVIVILLALIFRATGVLVSLIKSPLNKKERVFTVIAYMPKATVQAAIGGLPLAMGLACGENALTMAVVSIIITAPLGAILIDNLYKRILVKEFK